MHASYAIETRDLTRDFAARGTVLRAVDQLNFRVMPGEVFGFLGPNGAGKTTTLESLEGLRSPDGGFLQVMGVDPTRQARPPASSDSMDTAMLAAQNAEILAEW